MRFLAILAISFICSVALSQGSGSSSGSSGGSGPANYLTGPGPCYRYHGGAGSAPCGSISTSSCIPVAHDPYYGWYCSASSEVQAASTSTITNWPMETVSYGGTVAFQDIACSFIWTCQRLVNPATLSYYCGGVLGANTTTTAVYGYINGSCDCRPDDIQALDPSIYDQIGQPPYDPNVDYPVDPNTGTPLITSGDYSQSYQQQLEAYNNSNP